MAWGRVGASQKDEGKRMKSAKKKEELRTTSEATGGTATESRTWNRGCRRMAARRCYKGKGGRGRLGQRLRPRHYVVASPLRYGSTNGGQWRDDERNVPFYQTNPPFWRSV